MTTQKRLFVRNDDESSSSLFTSRIASSSRAVKMKRRMAARSGRSAIWVARRACLA